MACAGLSRCRRCFCPGHFRQYACAYGIAERSGLGLFTPIHTDERAARVDAHLKRYQIEDYRDVAPGTTPGRSQVAGYRHGDGPQSEAMLDEPTSGISVEEKFDLMDIIMEALRQEDTTVMFIEHDMEIVERFVDRSGLFIKVK